MTALLLLSGGMDSIAVAYWKRPAHAVTVDYGQVPAPAEIRAAKAVCDELGIEHHIVRVPNLRDLGSGDMAGSTPNELAPVKEWWPFRNQMLITLAAMKAVQVGAGGVLIGSLRTDKVHADGRPEFLAAASNLLKMQEGAIKLEAPAIGYTAVELVKASGVPVDLLAWAHSCHTSEYACGQCRGCRKHFETMEAISEYTY